MPDRLTPLLASRPWLLADGATGSNLFNRGLQSGDAPELWNVDHPQRIADLERAFVEAGADIILTNTFGGTRHRLQLHNAGARVAELNELLGNEGGILGCDLRRSRCAAEDSVSAS